jgi:hypothetical protein
VIQESPLHISDSDWDAILAVACPMIYRKLFQRLKDGGNSPVNGAALTDGVYMRIQGANQALKMAGCGFAIKPVPEVGGGKTLRGRSWVDTGFHMERRFWR